MREKSETSMTASNTSSLNIHKNNKQTKQKRRRSKHIKLRKVNWGMLIQYDNTKCVNGGGRPPFSSNKKPCSTTVKWWKKKIYLSTLLFIRLQLCVFQVSGRMLHVLCCRINPFTARKLLLVQFPPDITLQKRLNRPKYLELCMAWEYICEN